MLALSILAISIISSLVSILGSSAIIGSLFNVWIRLRHSSESAKIAKKKKELWDLKQQLNQTSAQDQFAKWAKIRRKLDSTMAEYEKMQSGMASQKTAFDARLKPFFWLITSGASLVIMTWYRSTPVFFLPKGWFGSTWEWWLAFPSAPKGALSVSVWMMVCNRVIKIVTSLIQDFAKPAVKVKAQ